MRTMTTKPDINRFTGNQFKYWMFQSGLSEEEVAEFLNTDLATIRGYMTDKFPLTEYQTAQCRWYLQNKQLNSNGSCFSV